MTYRVIAQDVRTGEFLNWNVPVSDLSVDYTLSGPGVISGTLGPEIPGLNIEALDAWSVWLHVEQDGRIAASGLLQPTSLEGTTITLQCEGPTGYAHGLPYLGELSAIGIDPLDIVRNIWTHIQSYPTGNLGLQLGTTKTGLKLGTVATDVAFQTSDATDVNFEAGGPYELNWWTHADCGDEINNLAKSSPFDYVERSQWNADKTGVDQFMDFGYPRLGRLRTDLRFASGENILSSIPLAEVDDQYASDVIVLGSGEGRAMIRGTATQTSDRRLRRVVVIADKSITTVTRATSEARLELARRNAKISMQQIVIDGSHPNARLGTFICGDDIQVTGDFPWIGRTTINHRITGYTWSPTRNEVTLKLAPSESFNYSPPISGS